MILWCDGAHDAAENMRRDRALLSRADAPRAAPGSETERVVLRLFTFSPPGITLGRAQDPASELDLERCARDGVSWAVRPTGGRAIFHAEEWTYSLCAPLDDPAWGGSLPRAYERLSRLVQDSLGLLGVTTEFAAGGATARSPRGGRRAAAAPCFASSARHEIVRGHRKLVGSAQRRTARALLQQGSVLLGEGHLRLIDYLRVGESDRSGLRAELRAVSGHAGDVLGSAAPLARWAGALASLLPRETTRLSGDEGRRLLTPSSPGSYTRSPM